MEFKTVQTAIPSKFDAVLEQELNQYEQAYGHRSMRIRPVIGRVGWIAAIEQTVAKTRRTASFDRIAELGLAAVSFESFVLRYPGLFSAQCIKNAEERLYAAQ